jgi:hypothetical protein
MIGRRWLEKAQPWVEKRVLAPLGLVVETIAAVRTRAAIRVVRQRARVHHRFPGPPVTEPGPRVLAVVTHVANPETPAGELVERLRLTLDGLLESLGHTRLELVLNTLPGRHAVADLPDYQRSRLAVSEHRDVDPMFVGFQAHEEFARRVEDADWFLYAEDDIVLSDGLLLEKLEYFNGNAPAGAVLLPHRYELFNGRKFYIDLSSKRGRPEDQPWNRLTLLEIGDWKFAEFENPHSGFFCLSQPQLRRWVASGRRWSGLASYVGPRESAATGALEECFRLYKPHPSNMTFLQIRHLGTKYAEFFSELHERAGA